MTAEEIELELLIRMFKNPLRHAGMTIGKSIHYDKEVLESFGYKIEDDKFKLKVNDVWLSTPISERLKTAFMEAEENAKMHFKGYEDREIKGVSQKLSFSRYFPSSYECWYTLLIMGAPVSRLKMYGHDYIGVSTLAAGYGVNPRNFFRSKKNKGSFEAIAKEFEIDPSELIYLKPRGTYIHPVLMGDFLYWLNIHLVFSFRSVYKAGMLRPEWGFKASYNRFKESLLT